MSEDAGAKVPLTERMLSVVEKKVDLPPPLPDEIRPSREALKPYIPKPELYILPDLPHHGVLHGEETAILAGVVLNAAYEDVLARRGQEVADAFRAGLDEKVLLYASAYHDCGRISDWKLFQGEEEIAGTKYRGEMQIHGPRGAEFLRDKVDQIDPSLSPEQADQMLDLVRLHTPTRQEGRDRMKDQLHLSRKQSRAARKVDRARHFEDYDPDELMLRLLQEADRLGLPRGYYSRTPDNPHRNAFATGSSIGRVLKSHAPLVRNRPGQFEQGLRFDRSRELGLWVFADALTRMSRRDPEINNMFAHVPHRSGAAMEAGQRIGLLKP